MNELMDRLILFLKFKSSYIFLYNKLRSVFWQEFVLTLDSELIESETSIRRVNKEEIYFMEFKLKPDIINWLYTNVNSDSYFINVTTSIDLKKKKYSGLDILLDDMRIQKRSRRALINGIPGDSLKSKHKVKYTHRKYVHKEVTGIKFKHKADLVNFKIMIG